MRNSLAVALLVIGSMACSGGGSSAETEATAQKTVEQVRVDKFEIKHSLAGHELALSLDTDLPDVTDVMVSVSRSFFEKGSKDEYVVSYMEEKSTVGSWRSPRKVSVYDEIFNDKLQERLEQASRAGIGKPLDQVADEVKVTFTVPAFQSSRLFDERNGNLIGKVVTTAYNNKIVMQEASIALPLVMGSKSGR